MSPGSANSAEQVQVDDADLGRLAGLFELLEQLVDLLQLFLDRERLRHGQRRVAGELVLGGQLVDLVLVAEPLDQLHQMPGERRPVVAGRVPQPLQVAKLLRLHGPVKRARGASWAASTSARLSVKRLAGLACERCSVSYFARIFRFRSEQHRDQRVDARAQAGDLARIEPNRPGQLFLGQLAPLAEHQHVLERRRNQVRRRLRRAGKLRRVVLLVRVNDAAEGVAIGHGESRAEGRGSRARIATESRCNYSGLPAGGCGLRAGRQVPGRLPAEDDGAAVEDDKTSFVGLVATYKILGFLAKASSFSRRRQVIPRALWPARGWLFGQRHIRVPRTATAAIRNCRVGEPQASGTSSIKVPHALASNSQRANLAGSRRNLGLMLYRWRRNR